MQDHAIGHGEAVVRFHQAGLTRQRRLDRVAPVVAVRQRRPEQRQHAVAIVALHIAAVRLDHVGQLREVVVQERHRFLGCGVLGQGSEAGKVGEQDRDVAFFTAQRRHIAAFDQTLQQGRRHVVAECLADMPFAAVDHRHPEGTGGGEGQRTGQHRLEQRRIDAAAEQRQGDARPDHADHQPDDPGASRMKPHHRKAAGASSGQNDKVDQPAGHLAKIIAVQQVADGGCLDIDARHGAAGDQSVGASRRQGLRAWRGPALAVGTRDQPGRGRDAVLDVQDRPEYDRLAGKGGGERIRPSLVGAMPEIRE